MSVIVAMLALKAWNRCVITPRSSIATARRFEKEMEGKEGKDLRQP
jgi:hypothetical protein